MKWDAFLFMFCSCFVYVLFMFCLCSVHVLFMFCSCFVYVLFMFCLCSVHVLFMFCCFVVHLGHQQVDLIKRQKWNQHLCPQWHHRHMLLNLYQVDNSNHLTLVRAYVCVGTCTYVCMYSVRMYSQTCLVGTLKGTPNLYFLSEAFTISTGWHSVHVRTRDWVRCTH